MKITRREEREQLLTLIFEKMFSESEPAHFLEESAKNKEAEYTGYVIDGFLGVCKNVEIIDSHIEKNLKNWTIQRLPKMVLAILRLSIYEIIFVEEIPVSVSIDEAVELAKSFAGDDDPAFINGVLGTVEKSL